MHIVIDANTVAAFFKEAVLGIAVGPNNDVTATVIPLFGRLGMIDICFLDDGKLIEEEWRAPVQNEWFDPWFARLLIDGKAQLIPTATCPALERRLDDSGFSRRRNRDIWYVRVCIAVLNQFRLDCIPLITEDIDFFDPTQKGCAHKVRTRILRDGSGPVRRLLRRENIHVTAICNYPWLGVAEDN